MLNATTTSTYGTIIHSPTGFYAISSVRIIHVGAVGPDGQLACTTSSSWSLVCTNGMGMAPTTRSSATFSGMNEQMQEYFSGQQGPSVITNGGGDLATTTRVSTNTAGYGPTQVISFSTPFFYFPTRATTEVVTDPNIWVNPVTIPGVTVPYTPDSPTTTYSTPTTSPTIDVNNVDYGFLPNEIVDFIVQNPDYSKQYPEVTNCLPGGPSILPSAQCIEIAPAVATEVPDLTTGSATTVLGLGCFRPGKCAAAATANASPASSVDSQQALNTGPVSSQNAKQSAAVAPDYNGVVGPRPTRNPLSDIAPIPIGVLPKASSPSKENTLSNPSNGGTKLGGGEERPNQEITGNQQQREEQGVSSKSESKDFLKLGNGPTEAAKDSDASQVYSSTTLPSSTGLGAIIAGAFGNRPTPAATPASGSDSDIAIADQTLTPSSSPIVVSGTTISIATSASDFDFDGMSPGASNPNTPYKLTVGSSIITGKAASNFIIGSQTLAAGAASITVGETTYSLAPSASGIFVNGQKSPLRPEAQASITMNSASSYMISGKTLAPGSAVIVAGTTYSLPLSSSALVVNGQATQLNLPEVGEKERLVFTVGSQLVSATRISGSEYVIASQTLIPGDEAVTISGVPVSLPSSGGGIIVAGSKEGFAAPSGAGKTNESYAGPGFDGGAPRARCSFLKVLGVVILSGLICGLI